MFLSSGSTSFGWGNLGHEIIGEIAFAQLSDSGKRYIDSILGPDSISAVATWADAVRSDDDFNSFDRYHILEIPEGYDFENRPLGAQSDQDLNTVVFTFPKLMNSHSFTQSHKMIMLRYLIHTVGDAHQPLHIGNGIDLGGNTCKVIYADPNTNQKETLNLHSFIDNQMVKEVAAGLTAEYKQGGGRKYFGSKEMALALLTRNATKTKIVSSSDVTINPADWYKESRKEHAIVYPDLTPTPAAKRAYCSNFDRTTNKFDNSQFRDTAIPTLNTEYLTKIRGLVEVKLVKAGLRLTALLESLASRGVNSTSANRLQVLKDILDIKTSDSRGPNASRVPITPAMLKAYGESHP